MGRERAVKEAKITLSVTEYCYSENVMLHFSVLGKRFIFVEESSRFRKIRVVVIFSSYRCRHVRATVASDSYCSGNTKTVIASDSYRSQMMTITITYNAVTFYSDVADL
jgi:hypothetical protein